MNVKRLAMIPSWLVIGCIAFVVGFGVNRLIQADLNWFYRLRRPPWLTFERFIPLIWIFVFTCGIFSASVLWEQNPGTMQTWLLLGLYLLLEIVILLYTPVMCYLHSLLVGTVIGGLGFILGLILTILVFSQAPGAAYLLLPYLLWSPIGTFVTWQMIALNPGNA